MPGLSGVTVALRIFGEFLDPDEITRLLGIEPTRCGRKGDKRPTVSGSEVIARAGIWLLEAEVSGDLNKRIISILIKIPNDHSLWLDLSRRFRCDINCGLFMKDSNEGIDLEPNVLSMLSDRRLWLGLDIYSFAD